MWDMGADYRILDSLFDGVLVIDRNYNILFANKIIRDACEARGYSAVGNKCHEFSHCSPLPCSGKTPLCGTEEESRTPNDEAVVCPHEKVFSSGKSVAVKHVHYSVGDRERVIDVIGSPIIDEQGIVQEMIEILRDVTEKEECSRRLVEREFFLESVLEGIGEGVVVVDRNFRIILANKGYCSEVKMDCGEIIGRYCYEVSHRHQKPCFEMGEACPVKEAFETGSSRRSVHSHFDKENKIAHIETISFPLRDPSGEITSAIEVLSDVGERITLENDLKRKMTELEEFYNMAVGRELKMVELKEEVEMLRAEVERHRKT